MTGPEVIDRKQAHTNRHLNPRPYPLTPATSQIIKAAEGLQASSRLRDFLFRPVNLPGHGESLSGNSGGLGHHGLKGHTRVYEVFQDPKPDPNPNHNHLTLESMRSFITKASLRKSDSYGGLRALYVGRGG